MEINEIYNKDCLVGLQQIKPNSIDLIITDAPYGDGVGYGRKNKEIANNEDITINFKVLPLLYEVLKEDSSCYYFTNWKFSSQLQHFIVNRTQFNIRMQLIIVKNNIGMGYGFRNQYEICLVLEKGKPKYNLNDFSNVLSMENIIHDDNTHPHMKGFEIIRKMVRHSSMEGDVVLDCFAGSGTTLIASKELNRNYIGFEIDTN